jgi:hypothetical protein
MKEKPQAKTSLGNQELDKAQEQFDKFDQEVKEMTLDRMNAAPKEEVEPQTKMSQKEIEKSSEIYLKPKRSLGPGVNPKTGEREKFNEKFRKEYQFATEFVRFIAENKEIIGETIEIWTKPFPGMNAEFWEVPCGKPIWGPRHLAEQISKSRYHRLRMEESVRTGGDHQGNIYYGSLAVDTVVQRLDAVPANQSKKSIFMGAANF